MEIIIKEGEKINRYKPSDSEGEVGKKGKENRDCLRIRKWRNHLYTGINFKF